MFDVRRARGWSRLTSRSERDRYETLAVCRLLASARAVFKAVIAEKPASRFRTRVGNRQPTLRLR